MRKLVIFFLVISLHHLQPLRASAEGLAVARYLEDPEHQNEFILFYLNTLYAGINLANERMSKPLFCMREDSANSAFMLIDKRIDKLQREKKLTEKTTVDTIVMDLLIEEFPCK